MLYDDTSWHLIRVLKYENSYQWFQSYIGFYIEGMHLKEAPENQCVSLHFICNPLLSGFKSLSSQVTALRSFHGTVREFASLSQFIIV